MNHVEGATLCRSWTTFCIVNTVGQYLRNCDIVCVESYSSIIMSCRELACRTVLPGRAGKVPLLGIDCTVCIRQATRRKMSSGTCAIVPRLAGTSSWELGVLLSTLNVPRFHGMVSLSDLSRGFSILFRNSHEQTECRIRKKKRIVGMTVVSCCMEHCTRYHSLYVDGWCMIQPSSKLYFKIV